MDSFPPISVSGEPISHQTITFLHTQTRSYTGQADRNPLSAIKAVIRIESLVAEAVRNFGGQVQYGFNDICCAAFPTVPAAFRAAQSASRAVTSSVDIDGIPASLLCGIHTGPVYTFGGRCYGSPILTASHVCIGGASSHAEVVLSGTAAGLIKEHLPEELTLERLKDCFARWQSRPLELYAVVERTKAALAPLSVFISYRREGGAETARLISADLRGRGVKTFLDLDNLGANYFDERLYREIETTPNFVLILSPGCLDRCREEGDWLRREIQHAIQAGRNIVPILKDGFSFPDMGDLPTALVDLPRYNCVNYSHEYFGATMDRLVSFLIP